MRKNLLIFLSLLLFSTSALAVERVIKWGYSTTDIDGEFGMSSSTGGAIYIPAEVAQLYKGFTLKGVMAGLAADANSVTVFATKTLGGTNLATATKSNVGKGDNEIEFDAPYTIDGDAFYVGYTYIAVANGSIIADGALSVYTVNGEQVENANLKGGLYVVRVVKDGNAMTKKVLVK